MGSSESLMGGGPYPTWPTPRFFTSVPNPSQSNPTPPECPHREVPFDDAVGILIRLRSFDSSQDALSWLKGKGIMLMKGGPDAPPTTTP